jgi:hypothetical protein
MGLTSVLGYKGDILGNCVLYSTVYCIDIALTLPSQEHTPKIGLTLLVHCQVKTTQAQALMAH